MRSVSYLAVAVALLPVYASAWCLTPPASPRARHIRACSIDPAPLTDTELEALKEAGMSLKPCGDQLTAFGKPRTFYEAIHSTMGEDGATGERGNGMPTVRTGGYSREWPCLRAKPRRNCCRLCRCSGQSPRLPLPAMSRCAHEG